MAIQKRIKKPCERCKQEFVGGVHARYCFDCNEDLKNKKRNNKIKVRPENMKNMPTVFAL